MKRIYLILIAIFCTVSVAFATEPAAEEPQTPDEIRAAAREQVISSLNLSKDVRKKFEPIYDEYRAALAKATRTVNEQLDEVTPLNGMKANLMNVAATAQVKLDYIDRFAEVLSSAQINQLYNSEGALAWTIRQKAGVDFEGNVSTDSSQPSHYVISDDGNLVVVESTPAPKVKQQYYRQNGKRVPLVSPMGQTIESNFGKIAGYHTLSVDGPIKVFIDPSATTLRVRCDRAFIDGVKYEMKSGELSLSVDRKRYPAWSGDPNFEVYLPLSSQLSRIYANNSATVQLKSSLRVDVLTVEVNNRSSFSAGKLYAQKVTVNANNYSKFTANVFTTNRDLRVLDNGMVLYDANNRATINGTVVTRTFVAKANNYSDLNVGAESYNARYVLTNRSKLNGDVAARTLRMELDNYSDVRSAQIAFDLTAVFEIANRSQITAQKISGEKLTTKLENYSKLNVRSGRASEGYISLSGRSECNASSFDMRNFTVGANDYSTANVYSTGKLRLITTGPNARINYSGNCKVETESPTIQRR